MPATVHRPSPLAPRLARQGGRGVRLAFLVALVAQLFSMVLVPVLHASIARPLAAHVEQPGAPHHTHDDASCAPCSASHALGDTARAPRGIPRAVDSTGRPPATGRTTPPTVQRRTAAAPRAPPTPRRVG
jgi:hypothetical protein